MKNKLNSMRGNNIITIYHASGYGNITKFSLEYSRPDTDYGKGVYFTTDYDQAEKWANKPGKGYIYVCTFELTDLNILEFLTNSEDFAETIHLCRIDLEDLAVELIDGFESADVIYGAMVDGRRGNIVTKANLYNEGDISYEEFSKELDTIIFPSPMNQLCMKTEAALNKIKISEIVSINMARQRDNKLGEK